MKRASRLVSFFAILACVLSSKAGAAVSEKRLALVIGNASYKAQPLSTAVNDAALVSRTLQLAGFDVTGARDLDQNLLRDAVRGFTSKVANAGPGAVVFVYFAGYAVQLAGENYLVPVGAEISDVADVAARTLSLSELMHALSALKPKATFVVLDAGRPGPFVLAGQAGGLAWTEPETNMLIAFSTAPGTSARDTGGSYGAYSKALAEMIEEAGPAPANLFDLVRVRVDQATAGGQVPWDASRIETQFKFFEHAGDTDRKDTAAHAAQFRLQPMRALGAQNAFIAALLRDTFDAYADFLADYWQDPMTKRVRALLAARRESITWERTCRSTEAVAYWSYLERYPNGPHAAEASRLLVRMGATTTPPAKFARMEYGVPPPLPDELDYIGRPTLILDDPSFGFEKPPPAPADFLGPPPRELVDLKPPAASQGHALPVLRLPVLVSTREPRDAEAPSNSSSDPDEAWMMKRAIDVPNEPKRQADSSLASRSDLVKEKSLGNRDATQSDIQGKQSGNQAQMKADGDRSDQDEGTSALKSTGQIVPAIPAWLTDVVTARTSRASLRPSFFGADMPQPGPSMFVSASAGLTFQTWRNRQPRSQPIVRRPVAIAVHPASPPPAAAGLLAQSQVSPISHSHATATIPRSTPRSAPLTSAADSRPSKPNVGPTSIGATPVRPRKKPSSIKPAPPSQVTHDPHEPHEAAPSDQ